METIKEIIISKGMKMSFVAKQIGVDNVTMTNWNTHKTEPKISQFYNMSKILGIKFCDLCNRVYGTNLK